MAEVNPTSWCSAQPFENIPEGHRGWWWWRTSAGVVVDPTKERLELPAWRLQKLALAETKPALLLFVCRRARRRRQNGIVRFTSGGVPPVTLSKGKWRWVEKHPCTTTPSAGARHTKKAPTAEHTRDERRDRREKNPTRGERDTHMCF